jgi:hypothetical protein
MFAYISEKQAASIIRVGQNMEAASSSEKPVNIYHTIRCHIPESANFYHANPRVKLGSHRILLSTDVPPVSWCDKLLCWAVLRFCIRGNRIIAASRPRNATRHSTTTAGSHKNDSNKQKANCFQHWTWNICTVHSHLYVTVKLVTVSWLNATTEH